MSPESVTVDSFVVVLVSSVSSRGGPRSDSSRGDLVCEGGADIGESGGTDE
jgi:hypothetical protein